MKVDFVYKYLTLGGVEAVLRTRLEELPALGVAARGWFLHDLGGGAMFESVRDRVQVASAEQCVRAAARDGALLVSIDTEEVVPHLVPMQRWVLECHSGYVENLAYLGRLATLPAAALVPSQEQARLIADRLPADVPVHVVPNPLGGGFVAPLEPFAPPPPRPIVAWVGRLDQLKNWRGFLALGKRLVDGGRDVELWLIGRTAGDATATDLRDAARQQGLLPRLRWWAGVPHGRMPRLLDAVRDSGGIVVSTSHRESFGLSVAEAMARGCPVVAPDLPAFRELGIDGGGLYRPGDVDDGARLAAALLAQPAAARGAGARARRDVLQRYAPAATIARLADTLRALG